MVDGYAVVAADLASGQAEFDVLEEVTAGTVPDAPVAAGPGHAHHDRRADSRGRRRRGDGRASEASWRTAHERQRVRLDREGLSRARISCAAPARWRAAKWCCCRRQAAADRDRSAGRSRPDAACARCRARRVAVLGDGQRVGARGRHARRRARFATATGRCLLAAAEAAGGRGDRSGHRPRRTRSTCASSIARGSSATCW